MSYDFSMLMKKDFIYLVALILAVLLLYFNWTSWHVFTIGAIGLILYYTVSAIAWGRVVERVLPLNRVWSRVFGFLVGFYLSAMAIGVPVVVWKYHRPSIAIAMFLAGLVGIAVSVFLTRHPKRSESSEGGRTKSKDLVGYARSFLTRPFDFVRSSALGGLPRFVQGDVVLFAVFSAMFVFFIFHARTGVYILSPWDALSSFTLMLFFVICFLVARMIFSRRSVGLVLAVIVVFSYLTHMYLPVIYEIGFGGDKWRHLGAEQWLQEGNIYTPSIWGQERSNIHFGPIAVPEALVAGNKTSYASQWSSTIMLGESIGVDLFWIDLLMVFLLWCLFLPLILYQFGRMLSPLPEGGLRGEGGERLGLLFAFLPTLFYTFQSEGAVTIPVSFGHLFFFFILLLWMFYIKEGRKSTLYAASALSLIFYWGYILNFFLLILVGILAIAWRKFFVDRTHWYKFKLKYGFSDRRLLWRDRVFFGLIVLAAIFAIPFLEVFQGLSEYLEGSILPVGILNSFADAFGRLSGFIGIVVPPDFIDQGNFLYNQSKESLSRLPLFSYRAVPFIVSMGVWTVVAWSVYRVIRYLREKKTLVFMAIFFIIILLSYFISWSFTDGVHILARRLNETIVFFMIIFLGGGISLFLSESRIKIPTRKKIFAITFALAFASTSTYASGPKLQLVTADELKAAKAVWSEHQKDPEPYCVIANTWPLLGLEAVSARKITAGNFPVYTEYAQPERVKIFEGLSKSPSMHWIEWAFQLTAAPVCYYMTENRWINDTVFDKTVDLLGEPKRVGQVYVWRIEKQLFN